MLGILAVTTASAAPFAYITNRGSDDITVIDVATGTAVATIPSAGGNFSNYGVAVHPGGTRVYVTHNGTGNAISIVDTATNTRTGAITVAADPLGIAINPAGTRGYVTHNLGTTITVVDTVANSVVGTITVAANPTGVVITPDGARAYVTHSPGNIVTVINTATDTVLTTIPVGTNPFGIAVNPAGTRIYVTHTGTGDVRVIDTATNSVSATVTGGNTPYGVAVTPDGAKVYQSDSGANTVRVIDTATNTVTATVNVGSSPQGIAVTPDGTRVYAVNQGGNDVSVIDTATNSVVTTVPVGSGPRAFGLFIGGPAPGTPAISVTGTTTFPATAVGGSSGVQPITITNSGTASLSIASISHSGASLFPDTTSGPPPNAAHYCGFGSTAGGAPQTGGPIVLAPAAFCTLNLVFAPNLTGALPATITVNSNAPTSPTTISLTGTGLPPNASISPASITFGNAPVSLGVNQISTFNNPSAAPYTITSLSITGLGFTVAPSGASPCNVGAVVNGGGSCTYTVTFAAAGPGSSNATTTVGYQPFGTGPTYSVTQNANGIGFIPPSTAAPASVLFGNVPITLPVTQNFTFTNNSNTTAFPSSYTVTSLVTTGLGFSAVGSGGNPCAVSLVLPPGTSCGVTVTFQIGGTGSSNGTTTIGFLAGLGADPAYAVNVPLNGSGFLMPSSLAPASVAFGNVTVGTPVSQVFTFTNDSNTTAYPSTYTITSFTTGGLGFSAVGSGGTPCAVSLALPPGASCGATVTLVPAGTGSTNGTTTIGFLAGLGSDPPYSRVLASNGNGVAATMTLTPAGGLTFSNVVLGGTSASQVITLTNTSPSNLNITSVAVAFNPALFPVSGTCMVGSVIAPAGTCTIAVAYTPAVVGSNSDVVTVSTTQGATGNTFNLAASSVAPAITFGGLPMAFGNILAGSSATLIATVVNSAVVPITIAGLTVSQPSFSSVAPGGGSPCTSGLVLLPANNCTVAVTYSPPGVASNSGSVNVNYTPGALAVPLTNSFAFSGSGIAATGPFAYIANSGSNSVSVIDTPSNAVVASIPVGTQPYGVAVNFAGSRVYVANEGISSISVIDAGSNTVVATVPVGTNPFGTAVNPADTRVYVTNLNSNSVSVVDTASNTVVTTIPVGIGPRGVAVSPTGARAYVANSGSSSVSVIDTASNTVLTSVAVGTNPYGVAVNPAGTRVYVANFGGNSLSVIDAATNTVISTLGAGTSPFGVAVNPAGTRAYVASFGSGNVAVIDTGSNTLITTVPVGSGSSGVALNSAGTRVYVTNQGTNDVSVIDTAANTVIASVPVGAGPAGFGVFIQPAAVSVTAPTITSPAPPAASVGTPYSHTFVATGTTPITWSIATGTLPTGLALNAASGVLSGTPTTAGVSGFTVQADNGVPSPATQNVSLVVSGAPVFSPSAASFTFGSQVVPTTSAAQVLTITNTGTAVMSILGPSITGPFAISANSCTGLMPLGTCTMSVTFTPTIAGAATGTLTIPTNAPGSPHAIGLSGTGVTASTPTMTVAFAPASVLTATNATMTLTLSNPNASPAFMSLGGAVSVPGLSMSSLVDGCSASASIGTGNIDLGMAGSIPALGSCTITVQVQSATPGTFPVTVNPGNLVTSFGNNTNTSTAALTVTAPATGPYAYIPIFTSFSGSTVSVIDLPTNTLATTITVGAGPVGAAVNYAGTRVYISNQQSNSISVIDTASNTVVATVGVGSQPGSASVNPAGTRVYVPNQSSASLSVIDATTNSVIATITGLSTPVATAVHPSGLKAYVALNSSNSLGVIDAATNTLSASIPVCSAPYQPVVNSSGTRVYVVCTSGSVSVVDTGTASVIATIPVGTNARGIALTGNGAQAWVTNTGSNNVSVIDTATNAVTATLMAGSSPWGVAGNAAGTRMYVANNASNSVTVFDTASNTIVATVPVGVGPLAVGQFVQPAAVVATPALALSPSALTFGVRTVNTTSPLQVVTLSNSGTAPLVISSITGSGDFAFTTTCPISTPPIAPAGSCSISISFTPLTAVALSGSVTIASNAPGSPHVISLSGTGAAVGVTNIAVNPTSLDFGTVTIATGSQPYAVTVSNTGFANLLLSGITTSGPFARTSRPSVPPDCGASVAPGAACSISLVFTPAVPGAASGQLSITHNASGSPSLVALTGLATAVPVPVLSVAPRVAFGDQIINTATSLALNLSNTGSATLNIGSIALSGSSDFSQSGTCRVVAAGGSCVIDLGFRPASVGARAAQLDITSNTGSQSPATSVNTSIAISGNGILAPRPAAEVSVTAIGFGNAIFGGATTSQLVKLKSVGSSPLDVRNIFTSGADFVQMNSCAGSLPTDASCLISIAFSPLSMGAKSGELQLITNAIDSPHKVQLSGTGCRWFSQTASRFFITSCGN